eukprot:CAMPEP_0202959354 /NCGR_PEP_ID=MMETSP1396-20130829/3556_1 /ASSEMBLY_ACC=CAM_ASM_000872 /TAXON_ID= /ORGANISM="Pseudokeronopsis sp., Strain Brazil" /LENGTH=121 /DNA_ID=CAMNT_0049677869 /DNA_START=34 /DNA_END=399 /DNA_ORIENTATION=+
MTSKNDTNEKFIDLVYDLHTLTDKDIMCWRGTKDASNSDISKQFKILSMDDGGAKTYVKTWLLNELEKEVGLPSKKMFNMIVGTGAGGMIALGLGKGIPAKDLLDIFDGEGAKILDDQPMF